MGAKYIEVEAMKRTLFLLITAAVTATTLSGCERVFGSRPASPKAVRDLAVVSIGPTTASFRWTQVTDGAGKPANYLLFVGNPPAEWPGPVSGGRFIAGDSVGGALEVSVDELLRGLEYTAFVVSIRDDVDSLATSTASERVAFTTAADAPDRVTDVTGTSTGASTAKFSWPPTDDGIGGRSRYALVFLEGTARWPEDKGRAIEVSGGTSESQVEWTASGLTAATSYQLIVISMRGALDDSTTVFGPPSDPFTFVTPTPPVIPPPAGGVEPFFEDDFESGARRNANGFTWSSGGSRVTVSNGFANSGQFALRFRFGPDTTLQDSSAEQRFNLGRNLPAVWIQFMMFVPANYQQRPQPSSATNNKFLMIWNTTYGSGSGTWQAGYELIRSADSTSRIRPMSSKEFGTNATYVTDGALGHPDQGKNFIGPSSPLKPGRWHQVRMQFQRSSAGGASDGILRMWIDGVLFASMTNGPFRNLNNVGETVLRNGYFLGWANSGYTQVTDWYIDDVLFYDVDPAWITP